MRQGNLSYSMYKIIKKKCDGNVSILIILVLVACSLMGILTMNFLRNLMSYTDDTYSYYKSYYIAKAGLELALTEINNTEVGFNQGIFGDSPINTNNFSCLGCHFQLQVRGRSPIISNNFWQTTGCEDNALLLLPAESITLPLFYDSSSTPSQVFDNSDHVVNISSELSNLKLIFPVGNNYGGELKLGVVFETGGDANSNYLFMKGISMSPADIFFSQYVTKFNEKYDSHVWTNNGLPYLVISNPNDFEVKFCIGNKEGLSVEKIQDWPTTKYFISSRGEFNGRTIGLQAIYSQPIPSFFINPYSN